MHHLRTRAIARFALSPVALVVASLLQPVAAQPLDPSPRLRASPQLRDDIPPDSRGQLPTFVEGDRISGQTDLNTVVEGGAELRRGDTIIRADRLEYNTPNDLARAAGNVRINKSGNVFEGPLLELKVDAFQGFFNEPRYRFLRNEAYGEAERIDFLDEKRSIIRNATYTTCKRRPGPSWMPDWILRASTIRLDQEEETGQAEGAVLSFFGAPILPVPSMSFPLSDKRKSGLLPPTIGLDSVSGFETTLPYYWNIAPNRDATLYPTLMSKRGIDLGGEFRYMEPNYQGMLRGNVLPNDRLRGRTRWGYSVEHEQGLLRLPGLGPATLNLNVNRVSDDNYWRDFSRNSSSLTQRLLAGDGILNWAAGDVSLMARVQKWQILQDPAAPIVPPFDRAPQLFASWAKPKLPGGLETRVDVDYSRFRRSEQLVGVAAANDPPNADRTYTLAQVSRPWREPGWFVVPKAQLHASHYAFDRAHPVSGDRSADRIVPTVSLDSGLVFERNASYFGRAFTQTLEPRAFYTFTPYRAQDRIPLYDSGLNDFNFATVYTENQFGGNDRIADNNLLTLGATTRLLDPDTGAEAARFGVAQRLRFSDQRVTLPGEPRVSERLSDVLFGASVNLVPQWGLDTTLQYNPKTGQSIRSTVGARYSPGNYRVVSAAYRLQRGFSEQLDVGWQWPLNDLWGDKGTPMGAGMGEGEGRWYSVGRLNLSLRDRRLVEGLVGLEYDAGCWLGRVVVERLQSGVNQSTKRILFQLEFVGFTRVGSNALQTLKENIPRYQYLRERSVAPSRFGNYD
ncbi:MAG: organic solvent tolerance protein precursor-like protein [Ramlibacter sp.]|uniref:LPS-assembly protein LptD n=1 Tax=Ramlibacter sp. TaxID=1917967 RepID=UPI00262057E8|nr:LPS-assembly protein LptD [Ramlibacter sp.]MDB5750281.1 organic solvent tolerance protein precursor-like protein [Ramlibacter sp.]